MSIIVVYDCEYLTKEGAMGRLWSGHDDPDPIVVQIGAVLLDLDANASIIDEFKIYIKPQDRNGVPYQLDPYFTDLTGISNEDIDKKAVDLASALHQFDAFSRGATFWSWGKDELFALGVSCFLRGIAPPISPRRFGNLKRALRQAGMPETEIKSTSSGELADYYGVGCASLSKHDGLDDAISLARAVGHLMGQGQLTAESFGMTTQETSGAHKAAPQVAKSR
ncbi:3'-5' exonuclease [Pseudorhodobacter sp.]|uniref:3'-5' exonuclease n=1 Tax=Pseudorhodobacter sp. TaxID=1934400 RepID=UPI002AFDEBB4|nr:3'-5' exonuclease [Pseudorhodobacter sp.]